MIVSHSRKRRPRPVDADITAIIGEVSAESLREYVEAISYPRHYVAERRANIRARDWLVKQLRRFGYSPTVQGSYDNVVASTGEGPHLLLGAHYDSVPVTPGADDNGSAVSAALECAKLVAKFGFKDVMIVFFNREEDGLLGSQEFVASLVPGQISEAHIFEMIGYCTSSPNSQRMPPGLPGIIAPTVGDFLALLANRHSNSIAEELLKLTASYVPGFPVLALKIYLGLEKHLGHLNRSDHAPFWQAGIPAIMWTDTSEFRNHHYHQASDTPDTLDYVFLQRVTQLALARALTRG